MKKLIKIFGVIIFVYCCLGIFNIAKAETPDGKPPILNAPGMIKKPVPVYCGPTEFMLDLATKKFNQQPLVAGTVIVSATGQKVAVLSVFVNKDNVSDMSVLMTMLGKNETCVIGYGHNLKFYEGEET